MRLLRFARNDKICDSMSLRGVPKAFGTTKQSKFNIIHKLQVKLFLYFNSIRIMNSAVERKAVMKECLEIMEGKEGMNTLGSE